MKIIAELGINTNGSVHRALEMVVAAKDAGCDGVKVQAYETKDMLPEGHRDWAMFEDNRLSWDNIWQVRGRCKDLGLLFGGTPMSLEGVRLLDDMDADFLKNGSDALLRADLIDAMLETGRETWVATGMATILEVGRVPLGAKLMACTSLYPCPISKAGLSRLRWAQGYSDHTQGVLAAQVAAALRAEMFEKHFTLNVWDDGPDHTWSADPREMRRLVQAVRDIEVMLPYDESDHVHRDEWRVTETSLRP